MDALKSPHNPASPLVAEPDELGVQGQDGKAWPTGLHIRSFHSISCPKVQ